VRPSWRGAWRWPSVWPLRLSSWPASAPSHPWRPPRRPLPPGEPQSGSAHCGRLITKWVFSAQDLAPCILVLYLDLLLIRPGLVQRLEAQCSMPNALPCPALPCPLSPRPAASPQAVACPTVCQFNNGSNISEQNSYTVNANGGTGGTNVIGTFGTVEQCITACLNLAAQYPIVVALYMYYIGGQSLTPLHPYP